jgi:hypothetical protein
MSPPERTKALTVMIPAVSDAARLTISADGGSFELRCASRTGGVSSFTVLRPRISYERASSDP